LESKVEPGGQTAGHKAGFKLPELNCKLPAPTQVEVEFVEGTTVATLSK
jgi:hypothetical protein